MRKKTWARGALLLLLAAPLLAPTAHAIEFVATKNANWLWLENLENGCMARHPAALHDIIYTGACLNQQPHGRGILFAGKKLYTVKMNEGREFGRTEGVSDPSVSQYVGIAGYIQAFNSIFLMKDQFRGDIPGLTESATFNAAAFFLEKYGASGKEADIAEARLKLNAARRATYELALDGVRSNRQSASVDEFMGKWAADIPATLNAELVKVRNDRLNTERNEREASRRQQEAQARKAAQEEQERAAYRRSRIPTACNDYYPGFVGRYDHGGFFSTADPYVVRYVNQKAGKVTIEGTASGNSLSYGQVREMTCIELWDKTK